MDDADSSFRHECDCGVCGGFIGLWAGVQLHGKSGGWNCRGVARRGSGALDVAGCERSECFVDIFARRAFILLGFVVVALEEENIFEGLRRTERSGWGFSGRSPARRRGTQKTRMLSRPYGILVRQCAAEMIAARNENQDAGLKPGATFKP